VDCEILPDFSKIGGYLYDSSDNFEDAGSVALLAHLKHKDGLILTTKHGAWLIELPCIVGDG
jgi:hypothetical protein